MGDVRARFSREAITRNSTLNLLVNLTLREVRSQYKRTALGRVWSLVNPLATLSIYALVFGYLLRMEGPQGTNSGLHLFVLWLACGLIPWLFISNGIMMGMGSLQANAGLLTKVYFPRHVLVTSTILGLATTFVTEISVVTLAVGLVGGPRVLLYVPELLLIVLLSVCFVMGIALALSVAVVYFGDLQHIWGLINQIWFYASGVLFPVSIIVSAQQKLAESGWHVPLVAAFEANPAYVFLTGYRSVLYDFASPSPLTWLTMTAWAVVSLGFGSLVFQRTQGRVVEEL